MRFVTLALALVLILCNVACAAAKRVRLDVNTQSTVLDGDATGLIEACGNQPIVGFTYCRVSEGDSAGQSISFIGPPAKCNQEKGCVFIKVWNNQSQLIWGDVIPEKQTRISVPWKTLLGGNPKFELGNRGFWTWNMQVYYIDPDGRERISTAQGDIVLRVYRKDYLPLHEVENDANFIWSWIEGSYLYRMTSGLRAYIKKVQ